MKMTNNFKPSRPVTAATDKPEKKVPMMKNDFKPTNVTSKAPEPKVTLGGAGKKIDPSTLFGKKKDEPKPKPPPVRANVGKIDGASIFGKKPDPAPKSARAPITRIDPNNVFPKKAEPVKKDPIPKLVTQKPTDDFKKSLEALLAGGPKPARKKAPTMAAPVPLKKQFNSKNTELFNNDANDELADEMFGLNAANLNLRKAKSHSMWEGKKGGIDAEGFADSKPKMARKKAASRTRAKVNFDDSDDDGKKEERKMSVIKEEDD